MTDPIQLVTQPGRLVKGHPLRGKTTDNNGKPLYTKTGKNKGEPRADFYLAVAFAKTGNAFDAIYAAMVQAAHAGYPALINAQGDGLDSFAWKYTDGDSNTPNTKGNKPCDQEGFPGHWIVNMNLPYAPRVTKDRGATVITDEAAIRCGDFVQVILEIKDNNPSESPGLYVNPIGVEFVAYGDEIKSGPDTKGLLAAAPVGQLPAGASLTPPTPRGTMAAPQALPAAAPPAQVGPPPAGAVPQVSTAPALPGPVGANIKPDHSFVAGPPPAPAAAAPPAPAVESYLVAGQVYPKAALLAAKYTEQQIALLQKA